jgi:hypothetical protein
MYSRGAEINICMRYIPGGERVVLFFFYFLFLFSLSDFARCFRRHHLVTHHRLVHSNDNKAALPYGVPPGDGKREYRTILSS